MIELDNVYVHLDLLVTSVSMVSKLYDSIFLRNIKGREVVEGFIGYGFNPDPSQIKDLPVLLRCFNCA